MPDATLLLVEDDHDIARPLRAALDNAGYEVVHVTSGKEALVAVHRPVDLVILDLGLPDMDGLDVCRQIRQETAGGIPVIALTARASEADVVVGLDAGADDYVTKPFRLAELQARIRAHLRRAPGTDDERRTARAQDVEVDLDSRRATCAGEELDLTPKEFDLLAVLVSEAGSVVGRDELMRRVWDENWYGSTKTLDVHVSSLRRKLDDDPDDPRYIATVRGVGLRFETGDES